MIQTSGSAEHDLINVPNFIKIGDGTDGEHCDELDGADEKEIVGSFIFLTEHPSFSCTEFICCLKLILKVTIYADDMLRRTFQ